MPRLAPSLALAAALVLPACSDRKPAPAGAPPVRAAAAVTPPSFAKDPTTARAKIAAGAVVIDVRTPDEFAEGHLPQAVNIPVGDLAGRLPEVVALAGNDKGKPVVVYCASGNRARGGAATLAGAGFTDVVNGGGLDDLQ